MLGKLQQTEYFEKLLKLELEYPTLEKAKLKDKIVVVRADLNLPIKDGKAEDLTRLSLFANTTFKELIDRGAKPIILTHQGRPGKEDFVSTKLHASILSEVSGFDVTYVPSIYGEEAEEAIIELKEGKKKALLLENTRFYEEETRDVPMEEHAKSKMVSFLSSFADYYINDAFSSSHRNHASLTGFPFVLPSLIGRIMEWELRVIKYLTTMDTEKTIYILGGAKVEESLEFIEDVLKNKEANKIITGGLLAAAFLGIGEKEVVDKAKELLSRYGEHIYIPEDFVGDPPLDIGEKSIERIKSFIDEAKQVFFNGPLGKFEDGYIKGSKEVLTKVVNSDVFSVAGGGHTIMLLNALGLLDKFDYVSTGGRALLTALSKKPLPALQAIERGIKP